MRRESVSIGLLALAGLVVPAGVAGQVAVDRRIAIAPDASIRVFNLVGSIRVTGWERDSLVVTGQLPANAGKFFYFGGSNRAAKLGVDVPDGFVLPVGSDSDVSVVEAALGRLGDVPVAVRSSGVVGATKRIRSIPAAWQAAWHSSASSGGRSGTIRPSTPAAAASAAKRWRPYCINGLK